MRAENDANCFALSEACDEENTQYPSVLGLILGTGFGGGFVINGKIHSGQSDGRGVRPPSIKLSCLKIIRLG